MFNKKYTSNYNDDTDYVEKENSDYEITFTVKVNCYSGCSHFESTVFITDSFVNEHSATNWLNRETRKFHDAIKNKEPIIIKVPAPVNGTLPLKQTKSCPTRKVIIPYENIQCVYIMDEKVEKL